MALVVVTMEPVPVSGRQVTCGVQTEHCSRKGYQAACWSYILAGVSPFVAAGIVAPQIQQHYTKEKQVVNAHQAGPQ